MNFEKLKSETNGTSVDDDFVVEEVGAPENPPSEELPEHEDVFDDSPPEEAPINEALDTIGTLPDLREDYDEVPFSTVIEDKDGVKPFDPAKKEKAAALLNDGPKKLNKSLILSVILSCTALFFIFTVFFTPIFGNKKNKDNEKNRAAFNENNTDYSALVTKKSAENTIVNDIENENFYDALESNDDDFDNLPPVSDEYQYKNTQTELKQTNGAVGGYHSYPKTVTEGLHDKNISGIKGITPTRNQYLQGQAQPVQQAGSAAVNNPYAQFGLPPKDDYTAQMLSLYGANTNSNGNTAYQTNPYQSQNDQSGKNSFFNNGRNQGGDGSFLSPLTIWQGTIFEATLTSNINTDLPGECTAWVTKNIYSSLDGKFLLIPQNSRLFGTYNSSISYSQSRVQVAWHTLIRPDGYMINLGNMQAADSKGAAGLEGFINDHPLAYVKALGLMSALRIITGEYRASMANNASNQYVQNILADAESVTNTFGQKIIDRAMDVQPTITIKAGTKINIVCNQTIALPPLEPYKVTIPYHR